MRCCSYSGAFLRTAQAFALSPHWIELNWSVNEVFLKHHLLFFLTTLHGLWESSGWWKHFPIQLLAIFLNNFSLLWAVRRQLSCALRPRGVQGGSYLPSAPPSADWAIPLKLSLCPFTESSEVSALPPSGTLQGCENKRRFRDSLCSDYSPRRWVRVLFKLGHNFCISGQALYSANHSDIRVLSCPSSTSCLWALSRIILTATTRASPAPWFPNLRR